MSDLGVRKPCITANSKAAYTLRGTSTYLISTPSWKVYLFVTLWEGFGNLSRYKATVEFLTGLCSSSLHELQPDTRAILVVQYMERKHECSCPQGITAEFCAVLFIYYAEQTPIVIQQITRSIPHHRWCSDTSSMVERTTVPYLIENGSIR